MFNLGSYYIHLPKVRIGDIILTRKGFPAPIAWATHGPFTHAELAVSRLLRFESIPTKGASFRCANIYIYRSRNNFLVPLERVKKPGTGIARINWGQLFGKCGCPSDYKSLLHSLISISTVVEHGKFYPNFNSLLCLSDVAKYNMNFCDRKRILGKLTHTFMSFIDRAHRSLNTYNGNGTINSLLDVGSCCSQTALEMLKPFAGDCGKKWVNTDISPNEITRLDDFQVINNIDINCSDMKFDNLITSAARTSLEGIVMMLNDDWNRRESALTNMLAGIEYNDPLIFQSMKDFVIRSLVSSSNIVSYRNDNVSDMLYNLESSILGPHPYY